MFWLEIALKSPFAPPIKAFVVPKTREQYERYKTILKMHLNYLMTQNYVYLASRFEKHYPVFFNKPYYKENLESLSIAKGFYQNALYYWYKVLEYSDHLDPEKISSFKEEHLTELYFMEDVIYRIKKNDLNYERVIQRHLKKINETELFFASYTNTLSH